MANTNISLSVNFFFFYRRTPNSAVGLDAAGLEEAAGGGLPDAYRGDGGSGGEGHVRDGGNVRIPIEAHTTLRQTLQGPSPRNRFPKVSGGRLGSVFVFGVLGTSLFARNYTFNLYFGANQLLRCVCLTGCSTRALFLLVLLVCDEPLVVDAVAHVMALCLGMHEAPAYH